MEFLVNFVTWFKGLPASAKLSLFLVIVGAVTAGVLLQSQIKTSGYQYLFTNLSLTDVNMIADKLQSMNVDAQVRGDSVLVPAARVLELRNMLAEEGLPKGGGTGFEIFDKKNFGATEFEQRINYMRAVQGEISRTISAIDGVEKARVHIVIPEKKLFQEDMEDPKASVALTLYKGRKLSGSQVSGIVHLVTSAVEGLTEDNINVVDQNGVVLFQATGGNGANKSAKHLELKRSFEANLSAKIAAMLEKIVGSSGVSVSVSADMDFAMVEKTVESIDPESRVAIQEQISSDQSSGSTGSAGGAPGAAANIPGGGAGAAGSNSETSKRTESNTTYAMSKTIQRILEPSGEVKKLSVAVLVDGVYKDSTEPAAEGEEVQKVYEPRPAAEIAKIEDLVKRAVGFDEARGDSVKVETLQFQRNTASDPNQEAFVEATNSSRWMMFLLDNGKVMGIVLIAGIIFFLLVKLINSYAPPMEVAYANLIGERAGSVGQALPPGAQVNITKRDDEAAKRKAQELAESNPDLNLQKGPEIEFREMAQKSVVVETPLTSEEKLRLQAAKMQSEQIISANPDDAVQVIRSWMSEE